MTVKIDVELGDEAREELAGIPAESWFTQIEFANATSPKHPNQQLAENNEMKRRMALDWVREEVRGKRVLDLFSANGAFAFEAAAAGASEVVGVEFAQDRVDCANWVASQLPEDRRPRFLAGDVYRLAELFDEPFDVTLCFGGLYHIADPAHVLRQVGEVTRERLVVQTSGVIDSKRNEAYFHVREDRTSEGMTSIRGGYGVWKFSPECVRQLLLHGGFDVTDERQPGRRDRKRFPWYLARCDRLPTG